jgi:hypothetical membrane protein
VKSHHRAAWGGIVGPAAFLAAWVVGSATRRGYSPVEDAISQLAAIGSSTRSLMTAGFVGFGAAVPVYATALRKAVPGPAWTTAVATGAASLVLAGLPLDKSATIDTLHNACAGVGYVTLAATPLLAARPLAALGHRRAAQASVAVAVASGLCLVATLPGPAHGLFQRLGVTIGHAWLVATAVWILSGGPDAYCSSERTEPLGAP